MTCRADACSRTMSSATSRCRRRRQSSGSAACARCPRASSGRNGARPSSRRSSAASRAIPRRCRGSSAQRPVVNGQATVELLKVLLRMTAERHGVAAKVIATVDDLERIASDDAADVPALCRLAARSVRREGARAQARAAVARDRERPRRGAGAGSPLPAQALSGLRSHAVNPREATHGPVPSQSMVHRRDLRGAWRQAARPHHLQRADGDLPRRERRGCRAHGPLPAPQGAALQRRSGRQRHPVRLSRHPLRGGRRLHPRAGRRADRPQLPRPEFSGAGDARPDLRLARRGWRSPIPRSFPISART